VNFLVKKKGLPEWGEFVLCRVKRVTPYAAWCVLIEYPDVEGMVHVSEVAGKWVHNIRDFVKQGKQYVAKVVKIDYQKNFVNLSLKRVSKYDEREKMNDFRREKRSEKMLEHAAKELGKDLGQAYEEVGFLLQKEFGELFAAFEETRKNPGILTKKGVSKEWADAIEKIVKKSFKEKKFKITAELELKSYAKDGVERIKEVLNNLAKGTGANVKYISAPKYRVEVTATDPKVAEKNLIKGLEEAVNHIKQSEGEGSYKLIR
jgi:translation initiation factor 2 subunit 1